MKIAIGYIISAIILFPILAFILTYIFCRKLKKSNAKSFGFAADVTTIVLFLSVSLSISSLWGINFGVFVFVIALCIAMMFTYIDWRTKKEIEILPLFRKIWRILFILLTITYLVVWFVGLSQSVIEFVA